MTHQRHVKPDWRDEIKVGDILRHKKSKTERVVRSVSFNKYGRITLVVFSILRCSLYESCWTLKTRTDINQFEPTGKQKTTMTTIDKLIALEIKNLGNWQRKRRLNCCDVKGVR